MHATSKILSFNDCIASHARRSARRATTESKLHQTRGARAGHRSARVLLQPTTQAHDSRSNDGHKLPQDSSYASRLLTLPDPPSHLGGYSTLSSPRSYELGIRKSCRQRHSFQHVLSPTPCIPRSPHPTVRSALIATHGSPTAREARIRQGALGMDC